MKATRLPIYGTLKRGHVAHRFLANQSFCGEGRTLPEFRLLELGWYPGLAPCATGEVGLAIEGEVWEVSPECLEELDAYESDEYDRRVISLVDHILAVEAGETADDKVTDYPKIDDGIRGMAFINAVVDSSAKGAAWTPLES